MHALLLLVAATSAPDQRFAPPDDDRGYRGRARYSLDLEFEIRPTLRRVPEPRFEVYGNGNGNGYRPEPRNGGNGYGNGNGRPAYRGNFYIEPMPRGYGGNGNGGGYYRPAPYGYGWGGGCPGGYCPPPGVRESRGGGP